jgi:hypothetical protein
VYTLVDGRTMDWEQFNQAHKAWHLEHLVLPYIYSWFTEFICIRIMTWIWR